MTQSGVEGVEVDNKISLTGELTYVPVGFVEETDFEDEFCEVVLLANGGPDARISYGFEVDKWADVSEDGFFPPEHHQFNVLFNEVVHPADILHSLDVIEVYLHQLIESV